jgi:hypothetical protein
MRNALQYKRFQVRTPPYLTAFIGAPSVSATALDHTLDLATFAFFVSLVELAVR